MSIIEKVEAIGVSVPTNRVVEKENLYQLYRLTGGVFSEQYFNLVQQGCLEEPLGNARERAIKQALSQAKSMSKFTKLTLAEETENLYAFLRTIPIDTIDKTSEQGYTSPNRLTDQRLMAEILRIREAKKFLLFTSAYPNIF